MRLSCRGGSALPTSAFRRRCCDCRPSIARAAGRDRLALNLERAAELVAVPQDIILETYEMMRPGASPMPRLLAERAEMLRRDYGAHSIAALIDEAVAVYERRNLFRRRY